MKTTQIIGLSLLVLASTTPVYAETIREARKDVIEARKDLMQEKKKIFVKMSERKLHLGWLQLNLFLSLELRSALEN